MPFDTGSRSAGYTLNGWEIADALRVKWGSNPWLNQTGNPAGLLHLAADE